MSKVIEKRFMLIRNLVYFFFLTNPTITAGMMYVYWDKNKVLKEYPRPEFPVLEKLLSELREHVKKNQ